MWATHFAIAPSTDAKANKQKAPQNGAYMCMLEATVYLCVEGIILCVYELN